MSVKTSEREMNGFRLGSYHVSRAVRSNLADKIEQYWVGKPESNIGLQYLQLIDGKVQKGRYLIERQDVLILQRRDVCNIFCHVDGYTQIDVWTGAHMSDTAKARARQVAAVAMEEEAEYVEHERRFLESKPWEQVYGMTPERAVAKLRELGW